MKNIINLINHAFGNDLEAANYFIKALAKVKQTGEEIPQVFYIQTASTETNQFITHMLESVFGKDKVKELHTMHGYNRAVAQHDFVVMPRCKVLNTDYVRAWRHMCRKGWNSWATRHEEYFYDREDYYRCAVQIVFNTERDGLQLDQPECYAFTVGNYQREPFSTPDAININNIFILIESEAQEFSRYLDSVEDLSGLFTYYPVNVNNKAKRLLAGGH